MSLVSAILFNAPPPVFHGHIRNIIAREMIEKVPASTQTAPTGKRPGAHELGRILRANIEKLLQDGEKWSAQEMADVLGSSQTSTRRHLNCLVDLGIARCTPGYIRTCRERLKYWMK